MDAAVDLQDKRSRRILWIEIAVVSSLYWLGATLYAALDFFKVTPHSRGYAVDTPARLWVTVANMSGIAAAMLFIIWGSGESLKRFGLGWGWKWSSLLLLPACIADRLIHWIGRSFYQSYKTLPDFGTYVFVAGGKYGTLGIAHTVAFCAHTVVSAFVQELYYRGYLINRFGDVLGRRWLALALSVVMFGSMHLYQGVPQMLVVTAAGIFYTVLYLVTDSIWPGVVVHTVFNLISGFTTLGYYLN